MSVKIMNWLKKNDVGAIGIGAMIVFIAMVLVAGIAASVLVQTANRLETQAMETGAETTYEVATGLRVFDIEGYKSLRDMAYNSTSGLIWRYTNFSGNDSEDFHAWYNETRIHNMTITVGPRAGSKDIDLNQVVLEISNSTVKCLLTYDGSTFEYEVSTSGIFSTNVFDLSPNNFGIIELEDADSSCTATNPVINRGDKVMLSINTSACFWGLEERTDVWGQVIPEDGAPGIFGFRTPAAYTDTVSYTHLRAHET